MQIVFMGTPEFALPSLKILLDSDYKIVAVITVPDKPSGRGLHLSPSPVKRLAIQNQLTILQPERLKDPSFIMNLESLKPDLFVVVAFRILPPEVFRIPKLGAFNLHASLLPKYRGAAPINWAIIRGEKETGVTTFFLQEKVDTGNIILQARLPIGLDETAGELHDRLAEIGAEIILHTVRMIESGKAVPKLQDETLVSLAPKIFKGHCKIDWTKSAKEIHDLIRGLSPKPGAYTLHGSTLLKIYQSKIFDNVQRGEPGEVICTDSKLVIKTGGSAVEIIEMQQEGKKKLTAEEFLRGYRVNVGEKFS
jgi:methionyl-tRNA formyltransferase